MFPLYVQYTRLYESNLNVLVSNKLRSQAVELKRYYHSYYDNNYKFIEEGIDSTLGYNEFNIKEYDTENYGIDQYESVLIYKYLKKINNLLSIFNIKTIQSGISYWNNDINFPEPSYFQLPWIEFAGDTNSIPIMKKIINHKLSKKYFSFTFGDYIKNSINQEKIETRIRTSLIRPFIDSDGNLINDFDDLEFWENIVKIIQEIHEEHIEILNYLPDFANFDKYYDSELDNYMDKPWFILNESGIIFELTNEEKIYKINPLSETIPLSTLIVRFDINYDTFMKKIDFL
jgi:hypothetical protein